MLSRADAIFGYKWQVAGISREWTSTIIAMSATNPVTLSELSLKTQGLRWRMVVDDMDSARPVARLQWLPKSEGGGGHAWAEGEDGKKNLHKSRK